MRVNVKVMSFVLNKMELHVPLVDAQVDSNVRQMMQTKINVSQKLFAEMAQSHVELAILHKLKQDVQ